MQWGFAAMMTQLGRDFSNNMREQIGVKSRPPSESRAEDDVSQDVHEMTLEILRGGVWKKAHGREKIISLTGKTDDVLVGRGAHQLHADGKERMSGYVSSWNETGTNPKFPSRVFISKKSQDDAIAAAAKRATSREEKKKENEKGEEKQGVDNGYPTREENDPFELEDNIQIEFL